MTYKESFNAVGRPYTEPFWTPIRIAMCTAYFACLCVFMAIVVGIL